MSEDEDALSVQVAVRVRPAFEHQKGDGICVSVADATESYKNGDDRYQTIQIGEGTPKKDFTFDHVLPPSTGQLQMYSKCVKPLVYSCLDGYNATIFAYGQSGSGKTHTIVGDLDFESDSILNDGDDENIGVIPRALMEIFGGLNKKAQEQQSEESTAPSRRLSIAASLRNIVGDSNNSQSTDDSSSKPFEYQIKAQFLELYGEDIHDLFVIDRNNPSKITLRDGKPGEDAQVRGAVQREVKSAEEALRYLQEGMELRKVDKTALNAVSSRSHCIFTLLIQQTERKLAEGGNGSNDNRQLVEMKTSKIHIVDLAGSEKIKRAQTQGKRLKEGININKGLFVLGNVISALGNNSKKKKQHVPYRDSKLTRLLRGSLGGNHKTLMIACVSPVVTNQEETLGTLRYANRAKNIKNKAKVNIDPAAKVMKELRGQVNTLAEELLRLRTTSALGDKNECPFSIEFLEELVNKRKWRASIISPVQPTPFRPLIEPTPMENQCPNPVENTATLESKNENDDSEDAIDGPVVGASVASKTQSLSTSILISSLDVEENVDVSITSNKADMSENNNRRRPMLMKSLLTKSVTFSIIDEDSVEDNASEGSTDDLPQSLTANLSMKSNGLEDEETILYDNIRDESSNSEREEEIILYDDMRRSMLHFIGGAKVEERNLLDESVRKDEQSTVDTFSSSATDERSVSFEAVEPEISSSLFNDFLSGNKSQHSTHIPEYGERYRALKLKWQINLIDTEISNMKEEKEYLKSIMTERNQSSSHISMSLKDVEQKIIDLKNNQKHLMKLSKRKSSQALETFKDDIDISMRKSSQSLETYETFETFEENIGIISRFVSFFNPLVYFSSWS